MSEAHRKALEFVQEKMKAGVEESAIQLDLPRFAEGEFIVNRVYSFDPIIVGMSVPQRPVVNFTRGTLSKISSFAKARGLTPHPSGLSIFLGRGNVNVAWLRENFFGAIESRLFEEIGREIYGLDPTKPSQEEVEASLGELRLSQFKPEERKIFEGKGGEQES